MTDYTIGNTIYIPFTTRAFATGVPTVLAGTPVISIYPNNSLTQITAGITLTVSHDSVAGLNMVTIVATTGNGYAAGTDYNLVITTGTVDSVSVVGEVVGSFSLSRSASFARLGAPAGASISADIADVPTVSEFNARTLASSAYFDPALDAVAVVTDLTNLPSIPANWLTAAGIVAGALDGKGNWNIDKTGYSLSQAFPANFADMAITLTTGRVTVGTNADKTGYSISGTKTTLDALNDITATSIVSGGAINTTAGAVDLVTTNSDMRGTDDSFLAANAPANFSVLNITAITGLVDITQAAADKVWSTSARALTDKAGFTISGTLTTLDSLENITATQVRTQADGALTTYDPPTNAEMQARTPTAAQLAYMVENATTGLPITFTTAGGSTTAAVLNQVDGAGSSATNDQYKDRLIVFTNGTLKGVVTDITGYDGTTKVATITAIPFAPDSSHTSRLI